MPHEQYVKKKEAVLKYWTLFLYEVMYIFEHELHIP